MHVNVHLFAMAPKKVKEPAPVTEKYDWSRTEGPRADDPRTTGPPCYGEHRPQPPGRGSKSGANKWGIWKGCEECGLRLSYTPTWGSHGTYRQAGPLPADVQAQVQEKQPPKGSPDLNNKKVALDAQERSLQNKLKQVHQEKAQWEEAQRKKEAKTPQKKETVAASTLKSMRPATPPRMTSQIEPKNTVPGRQSEGSVPSQKSAALCTQGYAPEINEEMYQTPGRKTRKAAETAEEKEYAERHQEEDGWSTVSSPPDHK